MPKCSIIIPVYNRARLTRKCLETLFAISTACSFEVVVVDDASTDETPAMLNEFADKVRVVTHAQNAGFATACNDGAGAATGEYIVLLNNDTKPLAGWLDALMNYADTHPAAAIVGSKLIYPNETIQHAGVVIDQKRLPRHIYTGFPADHPAVNKSRRFQIVTGACMLVKRALFLEQGGFDAAFRNGVEDVDFCLRVRALGHEVHYCHESALYHLESATNQANASLDANMQLYYSRWKDRVRPDDVDYYLEDGLLTVTYPDMSYSTFYPVHFSIDPLVGVVDQDQRMDLADHLLALRSRTIFELLRDKIRLELRLEELGIQDQMTEYAEAKAAND